MIHTMKYEIIQYQTILQNLFHLPVIYKIKTLIGRSMFVSREIILTKGFL